MHEILLSILLFLPALAQTDDSAKEVDSKVILIQEGRGKLMKERAPKVFVEKGSDSISGDPQGSIQAAHRSWDSKCNEWKKDLKKLNGDNLMVRSCGTPTRKVEVIQSEKLYTYSSTGHYKIRVVGK